MFPKNAKIYTTAAFDARDIKKVCSTTWFHTECLIGSVGPHMQLFLTLIILPDLLKANSFAQSKFFNTNFAQRNVLKIL